MSASFLSSLILLDPAGIAWQVRSLGDLGEEMSTFQLSDEELALGVSWEPRLGICKEMKQLNANHS